MGALEKKLYILHGWATDTTRWGPFLAALEKENITPVMLAIPGLTAPLDRPWTLSDYVEWLYETVRKDIKISLLGHSNGGRIALAFALKYPQEVQQIFLLDSAGIYHNDIGTRIKRGVFRTVAKIGRMITPSERARNALYKLTRETDYKNANLIQRETMKNLIASDILPSLSGIKTPVTIIWGREDQVTPFTDALVMKNGLPNAQLYPIKGGRHSPQFTHVNEVIQIVKKNMI